MHPSFPKTARTPRRGRPRVQVVDPDPYLTFLLRTEVPEVELADDDGDLVLVDLAGPQAAGVLAGRGAAPIIGVADADPQDLLRERELVDAVVYRPLVPAELRRAVRGALGLRTPPGTKPHRLRTWTRWARMATVGIGVAAQAVSQGAEAFGFTLAAFLVAYTAFRAVVRPSGRLAVALDVAVGGFVMLTTGGVNSDYTGFVLMVAFEGGLDLAVPYGALPGAVVALGALPDAHTAIAHGVGEPRSLAAALALFPLTAISGMLLTRFGRQEGGERAQLLSEAHGLLSTLYRLARVVPGGFDRRRVAEVVLDEARVTVGSPAAVLVTDGRRPVVLAAYGATLQASDLLAGPLDAFTAGGVRTVAAEDLPPELARAATGEWIVAPMRLRGHVHGVLFAARPRGDHPDAGVLVQHLAAEAAVGLENARLFARVQELSAGEERSRIARELHDGVAQALTHVHLELGLLARHDVDATGMREEAARLARVAERALADVRATISGLRTAMPDGGLAVALDSFVRDLDGGSGPRVELRVRGSEPVPDGVASEVLRIAQEAVSNALRHSGAARVEVVLELATEGLTLTVTDDGEGLTDRGSDGIGLVAMHERARRIGAALHIGGAPGAGVRVSLRWPLVPHEHAKEAIG